MNRLGALLLNDFRHAGKDPVILVGFFGPLILIILTRFGFPKLAQWLDLTYSFDLYAYKDFTAVLLVVTIPMLLGMINGLLILDERDENLISYFAVTPLMRKGYLLYRSTLPMILSTFFTLLFFLLSGLTKLHLEHFLMLLLLVIEAPWFALLVAAFSANKVEGLALYKIGALSFLAGPILIFFVPEVWRWVGVLIPTYWPAIVFMAGEEGISNAVMYNFSIGLVFHIILLLMTIRIFIKRVD